MTGGIGQGLSLELKQEPTYELSAVAQSKEVNTEYNAPAVPQGQETGEPAVTSAVVTANVTENVIAPAVSPNVGEAHIQQDGLASVTDLGGIAPDNTPAGSVPRVGTVSPMDWFSGLK